MLSGNFAEMKTSTPFRDLLHATNLRHGTDCFTSPPKEGVLRIFSTASAGFEPANLGTKGQHATPRPPKPLYILATEFKVDFCYYAFSQSKGTTSKVTTTRNSQNFLAFQKVVLKLEKTGSRRLSCQFSFFYPLQFITIHLGLSPVTLTSSQIKL